MASMRVKLTAIRALESRHGRVTPQQIVDAARDRNHPLHDEFEWNNTRAAELYRLDQARKIIASVRVTITDTTKAISTMGYVRDPSAESREQGYVSVSRLRNERDAAYEAMIAEGVQLQARLERMKELAAALDLVEELGAIIDAAVLMTTRLRRGRAIMEGGADAPAPSA